jgi:hypothetical protein
MIKQIFLTIILSLSFLNVSVANNNQPENQLPKDWVLNPEDQAQPSFETQGLFTAIREKLLTGVLGRIFNANIDVVDSIPEQKPMSFPGTRREPLRDETPWHLEAFTTELAVYASGLVGALTLKGQPAVQVYWKKQGPKPTPQPLAINPNQDEDVITYNLSEDVSDESLVKELEPMVKAALVSGKISDEADFRGQVTQAAKEFRFLVSGLNTTSATQWWLSTFRFDLIVGASGKLLPAPVLTTGGDLRLRFDWARMKRSVPSHIHALKPSGPYILTNYLDKARQDLQDFMVGMEKDLDYAFAATPVTEGLKAYGFKIALGITAKGNLGAVKGSASAFGHLVFSNPVKAPKTYPMPKANLLAMDAEADQLPPLYIIERNAPEHHIQYATTNMIPHKIDDNKDAYFKVDRKAFRKGLMKAVKIGQWFAKTGKKAAEKRKWKMYQLKSSFDLSISGNIELVSIGGTVSAEMSFYNMNF